MIQKNEVNPAGAEQLGAACYLGRIRLDQAPGYAPLRTPGGLGSRTCLL